MSEQHRNNQKSLTFAENRLYREIPNRHDIEATTEIWFSDEELRKTMTDCVQTLVVMQGGIPLGEDESDSYTSRGLEYMTSDGFQIANSNREVVQLLLEEQARQRQQSGRVDPNLLAAAIEPITRHRMRIARLNGSKDERAAKKCIPNIDSRKSWATATDNDAATEEVRRKIAERRKFRGSNRRSVDNRSAPARTLSDHNLRRPRGTHRVRVRSHKPRKAASLDIM